MKVPSLRVAIPKRQEYILEERVCEGYRKTKEYGTSHIECLINEDLIDSLEENRINYVILKGLNESQHMNLMSFSEFVNLLSEK